MNDAEELWNKKYDEAIQEGRKPQVAGTIADDAIIKEFEEIKRSDVSKEEVKKMIEED